MTFKRNTTKKEEPKAPLYHAWTVREGKGEGSKDFWTRIGTVWAHDDEKGATLVLDALPVDGRVVLRLPKAAE